MNKPNLTNQTLILTSITEEDTSIIVKWRSNPDVFQYFLAPHPLSVEEHLHWYNTNYLLTPHRIDWIAREKETNTPVGVFGLKRSSTDFHLAEVSYLLDPTFQGKGFASSALNLILDFCKEKWVCKEVIAEIHTNNTQSIKFILHQGFELQSSSGSFLIYHKML